MADSMRDGGKVATRSYDAVIVGGSLAGCTAATMLGRAGARVAVLEKSPDPSNYKRICSHFIQASAVPTLERLELVEPMEAAGAVRSRFNAHTPWGWIEPPPETAALAINLRREKLDPMVREMAASTPGVELLLGQTVTELRRQGSTFHGVVAQDRDGVETVFEAPLTIGADGRDSRIAKLSEVEVKTYPHGRFAYGGYFEATMPPRADPTTASIWLMDPNWAAAFPTDDGLLFCAAMATMDRLPAFKADPEKALLAYFDEVPEGPALRSARMAEDPGVMGKIDMTNRMRTPTAPGLALVGDAALATDPLFGVGCGWAFQSSEWLADAVAPALRGEEALEIGLRRYRRRHRRHLRGHAWMIHDYATGRKMQPPERLLFSGAARDARSAKVFDAFGARQIGAAQMMTRGIPLSIAANARYALGRRRRPEATAGTGPRVDADARPGESAEASPGVAAQTHADAGAKRHAGEAAEARTGAGSRA
ncbi:MAG TPA: NAD(P)/FAD-dependent oxidoreductase [Solirubrobacterales bacterium]|nr:NAD(P)/FAD-dependent oxidoreductase [Solirubrobacterales bacterium]